MTARTRLIVVLALFLLGLLIAFAVQPKVEARRAAAGPPQRIIALVPSHVELIFALGAGDRLVGIGDHGTPPPEAEGLPRCGGTLTPHAEPILALEPDLVVVVGKAEAVEALCRRYGIATLHLTIEDIASLYDATRELGRVLECEAAAEKLVTAIRADLKRVEQRVAGRPRPKAFLCIGLQAGSLRSLFSVGGDTFLSEALRIAGGENVLADVAFRYPTVSKEDLLARGPEVIIELHAGWTPSDAERDRLAADWAAMPSLPAVRSGRIHVLTDDYLLLPGPRVARIAERFAAVLHPGTEGDDGQ